MRWHRPASPTCPAMAVGTTPSLISSSTNHEHFVTPRDGRFGNPDRLAVVSGDVRLTTQELSDLADGGAGVIAGSGAEHVVYVGAGGAMLPLLLFSSARAGRAFTPINYRLSGRGHPGADRAAAVTAGDRRRPLPRHGRGRRHEGDGLRRVPGRGPHRRAGRGVPGSRRRRRGAVHLGDHVAPKAVELSHNNLTSYITGTVEFACGRTRGCGPDLRAAVSHRGRQRGPVQSVRGPKDGVSAQLRR